MRVLWIATKPPAPPSDGGRLLQLLTLEALAERGVEVTLVAPADPVGDRSAVARLAAFWDLRLVEAPAPGRLRSLLAAEPFAIARHSRPAVAAEVARLLTSRSFDAVHVEQIHALPQAEPALARGLPVVLRAQNVESDLWAAVGRLGGLRGALARREARRLATWEGRAMRRVAAVAALTSEDARRLAELGTAAGSGGSPAAGAGAAEVAGPVAPYGLFGARVVDGGIAAGARTRIERIAAPFPAELPQAQTPLPGSPAVVLLGSGGWLPNRDAGRWFAAEAWPAVRAALPGAVLHRFDGGPDDGASGVVAHPPPADSRTAFAPGAVLAVPLRIASGVRMKILEAWSRGLPVVASPAAAAGLDAADGRELLIAPGAAGFAEALARLVSEPGLGARLVTAGRAALASRHDPSAVAGRLLALYRAVGAPVTAFSSMPPGRGSRTASS